MSRNTENREEILKIHGAIDLINQKINTIENNHNKIIRKFFRDILSYKLGKSIFYY